MDPHDAMPSVGRWEALLEAAADVVEAAGEDAWLVGGGLRDALLGNPVHDLDVAVSGGPLELGRRLRERLPVTLAELQRDTVRVGLSGADDRPPAQLDLSPLRGPDIETDLRARDFTINALALPLAAHRGLLSLPRDPAGAPLPGLLDPLGGLDDLRRHTLALASAHALHDEPGRIVRAARMIASLGFTASSETMERSREAAHLLRDLSPDRIREELYQVLSSARAADGLAFLAAAGALGVLLPELGADEAQRHAIAAVRVTEVLTRNEPDAAPAVDGEGLGGLARVAPLRAWYASRMRDGQPRLVALRLGLLLHARAPHTMADEEADSGTGRAVTGVRRLRLPAQERAIVYEIDAHATWTRRMLAEGAPDDAALRHLFNTCGDAGVDVLVAAAACNAALTEAPVADVDPAAEVEARAGAILEVYFGDRERLIPAPLLVGADLVGALGMRPGPAIGRTLRAVRLAQLDGTIGTREEALAYARTLATGDGLAEV